MTHTPSLFDNPWPEHERFPLNEHPNSVMGIAKVDWENSDSLTMLTGFTSVEQIMRMFGQRERRKPYSIRIVIGNEPDLSKIESLRKRKSDVDHRMRDYWLNRGISILNHGPLLQLIHRLESGEIEVRIHNQLHGKVFVSDQAAMVGSSNFSDSGFRTQKEVNARFLAMSDRYTDLKTTADRYAQEATPFTEAFIALLKDLLSEATWVEALARASSELLEGKWLQEYLRNIRSFENTSLWPTQIQTISQAMYILDRQGSVLIADPTGSGKTKVGSYLLRILFDRMYMRGKGNRTSFYLICPPMVTLTWDRENRKLGSFTQAVSSGQLSVMQSEFLDDLRTSNLILLDEAHQYLSRTSKRSQALIQHHAEHVLLSTATPINKKGTDLYRMVELLGPDNLDAETLNYFDSLKSRPEHLKKDPEKLKELRSAISQFMVRHTKKQINKEIDRNPSAFVNRLGVPCRYPKHISSYYTVTSTVTDDKLATEINVLADSLKGLSYLRTWKKSEEILDYWDGDLESYVEMRIGAARGLSSYHVRKNLRSSRAALIEYLEGTQAAMVFANIDKSFKQTDTGNVIETLTKFMNSVPLRVDCQDSVLFSKLPNWLQEESLLRNTLQTEIDLLKEIAVMCRKISDTRETSKAYHLASLTPPHTKVIAYDYSLISTKVIADKLRAIKSEELEVIRMTGSNSATEKDRFHKEFDLVSESNSKSIAICTDALSEGINLQKASCVVFLDMPSVIRVAEQRAGRVDRLDSPHKSVNIYWPDDSQPFKLFTDSKFFERLDTVESVIGANIEIPESLVFKSVDAHEMASLYDKHHASEEMDDWTGMSDAFESVRSLIGDGGIIPQVVYDLIQGSDSRVVSKISSVTDTHDWLFLCTRGTRELSPQWLLIRSGEVWNDQAKIVNWFRERSPTMRDRPWDEQTAKITEQLLNELRRAQIDQLPPKRKRALKLLQAESRKLARAAQRAGTSDSGATELHRRLEAMITEKLEGSDFMIDWYEVATRVLEINADYYRRVTTPKKRTTAPRLKRTIPEMISDATSIQAIVDILRDPPVTQSYERGLVAVIVAVGEVF